MSGPRTGGYRDRNSTADRALDILTMFTAERPVMSGGELADRLGVARSTAYRYLQSLVANDFIEEAPAGGYRLGLRILEMGRVARASYGLSDVAVPEMAALAELTGEAVLLTRRVGALVVCVERADAGTGPVRIAYERGSVLPVNAGASALALLAWAPAAEVETVLAATELRRFTPATITDVDALVARMAAIRAAGFAVSRAELDHDIVGVAAPLTGAAGVVVAAISISALASRTPKSVERRLAQQVISAAAVISDRLAAADA